MTTKDNHEEKDTFEVDVIIPGHDPRVTTSLFKKSRLALLAKTGRCYICNGTAEETGHPLEAHHHPIERSFTNLIDWSPGSRIRQEFPDFDWNKFSEGATWEQVPAQTDEEVGEMIPGYQIYRPKDPYLFVDDMTVNGMVLCKTHHIGKDEGIHDLPHPVWIAQRYAVAGVEFSKIEIIHQYQE